MYRKRVVLTESGRTEACNPRQLAVYRIMEERMCVGNGSLSIEHLSAKTQMLATEIMPDYHRVY
jgi:hypothetical protein